MGNRGSDNPQMQFSMIVPVTPAVKWLIGINVFVWVVLQLIVEGFILRQPLITYTLGLVPENIFGRFFLWEPLTYMFLHSRNVFHIVFNMLLIWWLGAELEQRWGSRFFVIFYLFTGVGAGLIYTLVTVLYVFMVGASPILTTPVIGASGAVFGLLLAYGIIFGERIVYLMMLFAVRAKYFVMILAAIEVATLLNNGVSGGDVANLAHLGGFVSGFLFLQGYTRLQQKRWRKQSDRRGRGLKLVVNNEKKDEEQGGGPRYWN